ncbi:MAG: PLP-dependent aminotransferase family protein [Chloroflexota bacterium]
MDTNPTISLNIDRDSSDPAYRQVYKQLREIILNGQLPAGEQLPTSRQLSQEAGIARVTVIQAYEQLEAEGFIESRVGAGTFVNPELSLDLLPAAKPIPADQREEASLTPWGLRALFMDEPEGNSLNGSDRPEIDFGFGRSFAQLFPYDIWRRLLGRYLSTDDAMLSRYGSPAGFFPLRQAIADYLVRARGVRCTAEQVVIVSGTQQALDILARLILNSGDEVLVETPGYHDAYTLFKLHDARLTGIAVDNQGLPVADIPANCRPRLIFVTPSHQFPHGGTMPLTRRLALLAWAKSQEAIIVEDDYDGDLRYDGHSLSALQGLDDSGAVVYLGTFSKVLFPALRLGYVVLPAANQNEILGQAFTRAKNLVDRGAPTLTQAAVADFIAEGHFERHLRHLRRLYGERRQVLTTALDHYLGQKVIFSPVPAGLHVMLLMESGLNENYLVRQAASVGVRIYGGAIHYLEQPAPPSILLGFSGLSKSDIREGVRRLASVWP